MTRTPTLLTLGLSLLLSPVGALAYVDPYEALSNEIFFQPPNARHAQERVDAQNALYAARRAAANASSTSSASVSSARPAAPAQPAPVTDPHLVNAIEDLSNAVADLQDQVNEADEANARALARISLLSRGAAPQQPPTTAPTTNPLTANADETLRPGAPRAPLPRSGPATMMLSVLVLAAVGTVAWAQRKREAL